MQPTDVLGKLPKNFFEQVESPKWSERKECLEVLLKLCSDNPRLEPNCNYGELVSVLKKVMVTLVYSYKENKSFVNVS